jgi:alpha-amylase/alpha-mannosidase (GH57 family)
MSTHNKYICIHGHFYQPPRENAWLEVIEFQESAAPFHDWNERINFECYAPNAASRILDDDGYIIRIVNNYSKISFNFGPTLLSWMEREDPVTYKGIQEADKLSIQQFGFGSAMAQVHSHLILPLCNRKDKETQVKWGIKDFEYRFGRKPDGMWLAETAADTETLEVLAEQGIRFTVLAPRQAKAVRQIGSNDWISVDEGSLETRQPYLCKLPSGKEIVLFFYHGSLSQGVAFNGLLNNGKEFARQLMSGIKDGMDTQLVHIATDGESYGHHHRYGEMALSACIEQIEQHPEIDLINYAAYLDLHPPVIEAQIHENSSWSCAHGVERWRSNCGCNTGGNPGWNQEWRKPLRDTLNWLRDSLIPVYEEQAGKLLKDVWAARNDYIDVLLDRRPKVIKAFLAEHCKKQLHEQEEIQLLRLMEMQRNALLMFTSCGWFFDEISGIETLQIMQYANRAIYYAGR